MNIPSQPHSFPAIREARPEDTAAFRMLRLQALHDHPSAFSADYTVNQERPLSFWSDRLANLGKDTIIYFAADSEDLVGMCGLYWDLSPKARHSGTIWGVYVLPEWRGRRIADTLIERCVGYGIEHGIAIFKLGVVTTNAAAIRCYLRCGFKVYGVEPQAIFTGGVMYDELLMVKQL